MTIAPVLNIDIGKMGTLRILTIIDDAVYVCNCTVYSYALRQHTQYAFVYYIIYLTEEKGSLLC